MIKLRFICVPFEVSIARIQQECREEGIRPDEVALTRIKKEFKEEIERLPKEFWERKDVKKYIETNPYLSIIRK